MLLQTRTTFADSEQNMSRSKWYYRLSLISKFLAFFIFLSPEGLSSVVPFWCHLPALRLLFFFCFFFATVICVGRSAPYTTWRFHLNFSVARYINPFSASVNARCHMKIDRIQADCTLFRWDDICPNVGVTGCPWLLLVDETPVIHVDRYSISNVLVHTLSELQPQKLCM